MTADEFDLSGRVALVTGGSRGIGRAVALALARRGATVAVASRRLDACEQVAAEIRATGGVASAHACHIGDPAAIGATLSAIDGLHGRIDILVNNAGISGSAVPDVTELDLFDRLISVNLRGTFLGIRAVVPHMAAAGGGSIVNISSICSHVGTPGVHVGYHASKGGIRALTKAAAAQYGPQKIRVNSIHPGAMPPMRDRQLSSHAARDRVIARVPLGRVGEVDDVAHTVVFLASDESAYITGAELVVDGGFLAT